jgi:ribulose-5-phosphate 4-epimerase/fuculose-1-phosphate aldolase
MLPLNQHALLALHEVAYHDYEGPALDHDERVRIVEDLGDRKILILRNHGLLTVGRTIGEAFVWMYRAERACRMQLAFQQSGAEWYPISEEVQQITMERARKAVSAKGHRPSGKLEWPALLRKLDKIDTSYKS